MYDLQIAHKMSDSVGSCLATTQQPGSNKLKHCCECNEIMLTWTGLGRVDISAPSCCRMDAYSSS